MDLSLLGTDLFSDAASAFAWDGIGSLGWSLGFFGTGSDNDSGGYGSRVQFPRELTTAMILIDDWPERDKYIPSSRGTTRWTGLWFKELPHPHFDIDTRTVLNIIFTLEETPLEQRMNPVISVVQTTLEAIPCMLDHRNIHTHVINMNGVQPDGAVMGRISTFIKNVIEGGLIVNLILDTHANIKTGQVCTKPARGKQKPAASTLHIECFLGHKVLKAFEDPRLTVNMLISTCGPMMLLPSARAECHTLMMRYNINYIIGTDCGSLVPAMTSTAMARVLQLISSFKMSPKDAIEEACSQRMLGMYTRIILMTLIELPGRGNFEVNDIMFAYAAGTVRPHGLTNPICIHCEANTKEEQVWHKWHFRCLKCMARTAPVECPADVTAATLGDLTNWVWVQGRKPSWDYYKNIWEPTKKEAIPPKNKGKERAITGITGTSSTLPKVAGDPQAHIRELEKKIAILSQQLNVQTNETIRRSNLLDSVLGEGKWEKELERLPTDDDEMEIDDNI
ncbi:hypothetical protein M422DRAFT_270977 [Sphaerobolus stellatus SS14]|uniref:Uncharacterized protein n=1 Tax=Sphaerobolus stellatus (strain SS14) TaxID=990650 RepID=A0A0C9UR21_SPHS4|nr:hypothetical protein M422DRAFT_270977 [Sphaerobolus stellatus SS14]